MLINATTQMELFVAVNVQKIGTFCTVLSSRIYVSGTRAITTLPKQVLAESQSFCERLSSRETALYRIAVAKKLHHRHLRTYQPRNSIELVFKSVLKINDRQHCESSTQANTISLQ